MSLLIGMAMMRDESVERVAPKFNIALPVKTGALAARSGLTQARRRSPMNGGRSFLPTRSSSWTEAFSSGQT